MSSTVKSMVLPSLDGLPRSPASDLKKIGWRGMMNMVRGKGTLVVTNHNEPEAVIIAIDEFEALMHLAGQSQAKRASALVDLRDDFDKRLSVLEGQSAAARLRATMRTRTKLGGKVKAGERY